MPRADEPAPGDAVTRRELELSYQRTAMGNVAQRVSPTQSDFQPATSRGNLPRIVWIRKQYLHLTPGQTIYWSVTHRCYETRAGQPAVPTWVIRHWWGVIFSAIPNGQLQLRIGGVNMDLLPDRLRSGTPLKTIGGTTVTVTTTRQRRGEDDFLYRLRYPSGIRGNKTWTREELQAAGMTLARGADEN